jgi:hypothetical protein
VAGTVASRASCAATGIASASVAAAILHQPTPPAVRVGSGLSIIAR